MSILFYHVLQCSGIVNEVVRSITQNLGNATISLERLKLEKSNLMCRYDIRNVIVLV